MTTTDTGAPLNLVTDNTSPTARPRDTYAANFQSINDAIGPLQTGMIVSILNHGAFFDGRTDDTAAINTLGATLSAAGGGTIYFPPKTGVIKRSSVGNQASGLIIYSNVEYHFDNTTLLLEDNCNMIRAASVLGTGIVITADTALNGTTLTVTSSSSFTVGQQVFLQLGQATYDTGEPDHWLWAKILSIPDSTHVQLDRPVGYAMSVSGTTNTAHRSIYPFTSICENWAITGSVNLVNPMTGSANAESGLSCQYTRNARIEKISGTDVGAGLLALQYVENIHVDVATVQRCTQQNSQASKGNGIVFAEARNVRIETANLTDCQNLFVSAESRCDQVTIGSVHIDNGFPGRSAATALFLANGNARYTVEHCYVSGAASLFHDTAGGNGQQTTEFGDVTFEMGADPTISDLSIIQGVLKIRGNVYDERRRYSQLIPLTPSMSNVAVQLIAGLVRSMRVYASSTTGITQVLPASQTATGSDLSGSLISGQLVKVSPSQGFNIASGAAGAMNNGESRKQFFIYTGSSVPTGAYLIVEIEYYRPSNAADDYSQGRIDPSSAALKLNDFPFGTPTTGASGNISANAGDAIDTTSNAAARTLPTAPSDGTLCAAKMVAQGGTNLVTINTGGSDVFDKTGGVTSTQLYIVGHCKIWRYKASSGVWITIADNVPLSKLPYFASTAWLIECALAEAFILSGSQTYDATFGTLTASNITWPDGTTGAYATTSLDTNGAPLGFTATYVGATHTYTVTGVIPRNSSSQISGTMTASVA